MTPLLIGLLTGMVAGAHIATWGMYKDSPHEGFTWARYSRGIVFAAVIGVLAVPATGLDPTRADSLVVLFGVIYLAERAVEEFYKTFLREEDQSKYTIPMQFHVLGHVAGRGLRLTVAAGVLGVASLLVWMGVALQRSQWANSLFAVAGMGTLVSWLSAVGGAWKDAPIEGFEILKFFRSPAIALAYALLLMRMTDNLLLLALAAAGYTIATIETYKTFFFPHKPRGKFSGKPVLFPVMLRRRRAFVPVYAAIWMLMIAGFAAGLLATG